MVFFIALLWVVCVGSFVNRYRRYRRLPKDERPFDPVFGSRSGRFVSVAIWLLLIDVTAFLLSFGYSLDHENEPGWMDWANSILLVTGVVLLGLVMLGAIFGPFVERRRRRENAT
ncbi:MAG TPA: hypothetical protein VMN79_14125 [Casimicrobiaceae bacterium]|nr:hypothetical protein [Casimicrobiaceae bacterium]